MPQSLVLNLVTQSAVPPRCLQGDALQQLFFSLVEVVDPELAHVLRRDPHNRAYSLSALQVDGGEPQCLGNNRNVRLLSSNHQVTPPLSYLQYGHDLPVPAQANCWWRITFLDDDLFDHLIFLWNQLNGERFELGSAWVQVAQVSAALPGSPWASTCSYPDIYEQASSLNRDICLEFVTPTAFELEGALTQLPTAEVVFQPLRRHWNRYSGLAFAPSLISALTPTHFNIQTETIQVALHNSLQTTLGCTGQITFQIGHDYDPLTVKRLNTLANFTQYCSVGHNSLFGMGVLRRVPVSPAAASSAQRQ